MKRNEFTVSVQALNGAVMHGKKLCFTDAPTTEEIRLAELPYLNTFTAMQLISYAYNEALDLDSLLTKCKQQEVLEQACSGATPAMLRNIAGSLQQLQETLLQEDTKQPHEHQEEGHTDIQPESMMAKSPVGAHKQLKQCMRAHLVVLTLRYANLLQDLFLTAVRLQRADQSSQVTLCSMHATT
jgi:hypothetical protein